MPRPAERPCKRPQSVIERYHTEPDGAVFGRYVSGGRHVWAARGGHVTAEQFW